MEPTTSALSRIPALDRTDLRRKTALEQHHWWYRGRRAVLRAALRRVHLAPGGPVLDAGCGTGSNLELLAAFGPVAGVDINPSSVDIARERGIDAHHASIERLPFDDGQFELAACLDVLEHVADDAAALCELHRVTGTGGRLVVTVPAYPSLMAEHDRAAGHLRRYARRSLLELTAAAGWRPLLVSHFNSLLLPIAVVHRRLSRRRLAEPKSDLLRTRAPLDGLLTWPLRAEARMIGAGLELPAGLSILLVLGKR